MQRARPFLGGLTGASSATWKGGRLDASVPGLDNVVRAPRQGRRREPLRGKILLRPV